VFNLGSAALTDGSVSGRYAVAFLEAC
jgi:hypothetical protein